MAEAIAAATAAGAISVVGGGDTATAAKKFKVIDKGEPTLPPAVELPSSCSKEKHCQE